MNLDKYFNLEGEKPLDNLIEAGGGLTSIFRTIGVIGDSLSSGEMESFSDEGFSGWHDMYEYSWGQYMARAAGCKVYNFSKGGMTAKVFMEDFYAKCGIFDNDKMCQAYIIALGVNDISRFGDDLGTIDDIDAKRESVIFYYSEIIRALKWRQPKAKFFLMTIPNGGIDNERAKKEEYFSQLIRDLTKKYQNTYVLDFRKYAPVYDDAFQEKFFFGHMSAAGYMLTSQMVMSYIDYIIRHNMDDFKQVPFIGTPWHNINVKW